MAGKKDPDVVKAEMDAAAEVASKELKKLDKGAVKAVGEWMNAHYLTAGYKRLSKQLIATANG